MEGGQTGGFLPGNFEEAGFQGIEFRCGEAGGAQDNLDGITVEVVTLEGSALVGGEMAERLLEERRFLAEAGFFRDAATGFRGTPCPVTSNDGTDKENEVTGIGQPAAADLLDGTGEGFFNKGLKSDRTQVAAEEETNTALIGSVEGGGSVGLAGPDSFEEAEPDFLVLGGGGNHLEPRWGEEFGLQSRYLGGAMTGTLHTVVKSPKGGGQNG